MKMSGEHIISAPRDEVWEALRDPKVLAQTIPGAIAVEKTSDANFEAIVQAKIGPISARFTGNITLSDDQKPESFTLSGQGKGGAAGFAQGSARIRLAENNGGTKLIYEVSASVGGKIAQIGQRLIDATAKKMAAQFFDAFSQYMAGNAPSGDKTLPSTLYMFLNTLWLVFKYHLLFYIVIFGLALTLFFIISGLVIIKELSNIITALFK